MAKGKVKTSPAVAAEPRQQIQPPRLLPYDLLLRMSPDRNDACEFTWIAGKTPFEETFQFEGLVEAWWSDRFPGGESPQVYHVHLQGDWAVDSDAGVSAEETADVTDAVYQLLDALTDGNRLQAGDKGEWKSFRLRGRSLDQAEYEKIKTEVLLAEQPEKSHNDDPLKPKPSGSGEVLPPSQPKEAHEFDRLVTTMAGERERQASGLQPVLVGYLRKWQEAQKRMTAEQQDRSGEEIARAKKDLVEHVNEALDRLGLSLYREQKACHLMVAVDKDHQRGTFCLIVRGEKKPLRQKAYLDDLFDFDHGQPELGIAPARRESLVEWRERARRSSTQANRRRN